MIRYPAVDVVQLLNVLQEAPQHSRSMNPEPACSNNFAGDRLPLKALPVFPLPNEFALVDVPALLLFAVGDKSKILEHADT